MTGFRLRIFTTFLWLCSATLAARHARADRAWEADTSPFGRIHSALVADRANSMMSAYLDGFFEPDLCGPTATESDTDFVQHLVRSFARRAPTAEELELLSQLLNDGYPRRTLAEAVIKQLPSKALPPRISTVTEALRWQWNAVHYRDLLEWFPEGFAVTEANLGVVTPLLAMFEGADVRRALQGSVLIYVMAKIPEDNSEEFVRVVYSILHGRAPNDSELSRELAQIPAIDRNRQSRTPLWVRFGSLDSLFTSSELLPRRLLELTIKNCRPPLSGELRNDLPHWLISRDAAAMHVLVSIALPPEPPPPYGCTAWNPHLISIGHIGSGSIESVEGCAKNHAFYALDRGDRGVVPGMSAPSVEQQQVTGYCCRLPSTDILTEEYRFEPLRCPSGYVATGGRSLENLDHCNGPTERNCSSRQRHPRSLIRCTKINERRYQLSRSRSGRRWVEKAGDRVESARPIQRVQLPIGIRERIGMRQPMDRRPDGCVGWPAGSLFVERAGPLCEQHYFRELQYRGQAGDPHRGTPVKMMPDCDELDVTNPAAFVCKSPPQ